jgi:hypothetical protein
MDRDRMPKKTDVEQAIGSMDIRFVHCRDYGHGWGPKEARKIRGGYERVLRCRDCGATQLQLLDNDCEPIKNPSRRYPDGYLVKGLGRLTGHDRALVRKVSTMDMIR